MTAPGEGEDIEIKATLRNEVSGPAEKASRSIGDVKDSAEGASPAVEILQAALNDLADELRKVRRDAAATQRELDKLSRTSVKTSGGVKKTKTEVSDLHKKLDKMSKGNFDFGKIMSAYKIPVVVQLVTLLGAAVSALGAVGIAAAAGLAPLSGLLIAYPGIALAAMQATQVFKLATSGLAAAIKVLNNPASSPKQITAALKGMSPEAKNLAKQISALSKGPFKDLRNAVQASALPGFSHALDDLTTLLPTVRQGLVGTAGVLGQFATNVGKAASTPIFRKELGVIMHNNNVMLANFGAAAIHLLNALRGMLVAGGPFLIWLSQVAKAAATSAEQFVNLQKHNGNLTAFFVKTRHVLADVAEVVYDLGAAFFNVARQSAPLTHVLSGGILGVTNSLRRYTESVQGQKDIRAFFIRAIPVVQEFGRLLIDLLHGLATLSGNSDLAPVIAQIRTQLLPALLALSQGVTSAFGPALISAATAFVDFNNALTFSPLATVLQLAANAVILLTKAVANAPFPLNVMLSSILALSLGLKGLSFVAAQAGVLTFIKTLSGATALGTGKGLGGFINGLRLAGMQQTTFAGKLGAMTRLNVGGFFKMLGSGAVTAAKGMYAFTASLLTNPIFLIVAGIVLLVAGFILAYKKVKWFHDAVDKTVRAIVIAFKDTVSWLKEAGAWIVGFAKATAGFFVGVWNAVYPPTKTFFEYVFKIARIIVIIWSIPLRILATLWITMITIWVKTIVWFWNNQLRPILFALMNLAIVVFNTVKAIGMAVWAPIAAAATFMFGLIVTAVRWWSGVWAAIFRFIFAVALAVWRPIAAAAQAAFAYIAARVQFVAGVIAGAWENVKANTARAFTWVWQKIAGVAGTIKGIFSSVGSFISGVWSKVAGGLESAVSGIKGILNDIIGTVNKAVNAFNKLPGPDIPTIPMLFTGGPVTGGMQAMVGELGPEAFVSNIGTLSIIGADGPGLMRFPTGGEVVPAHLLQQATRDTDSKLPTALLAALRGTGTPERSAPRVNVAPVPHEDAPPTFGRPGGGPFGPEAPMTVSVNFYGPVSSEVDVERAVESAMTKRERLKKERQG